MSPDTISESSEEFRDGEVLCDSNRSIKDRFQALFSLRNKGGPLAVELIGKCFHDPSVLLKHELAFCLGQMRHPAAIPVLISVLEDEKQEPMVRHEAGEALGAIGSPEAIDVLMKFCSDKHPEVSETCMLAVERLKWLQHPDCSVDELSNNPYYSTDPAPPLPKLNNVDELRSILLDEQQTLWQRYRALFSLRNIGSSDAVRSIAEGLKCEGSALFRHEIAYVLGQIQSPVAIENLKMNLKDASENCMVRHECAEALGAIAAPECVEFLKQYLEDPEPVVYESCEVALDITDYEKSLVE